MTTKLTDRQKEEIHSHFQLLDTHGNGQIDHDWVAKLLRALGQNPTYTELRELEEKYGYSLDYISVVSLIEDFGLKSREEEEEELRIAFKAIDRDRDGKISKKELKRYLCLVGDQMTEEEVDELMLLSDVNKDGVIDYQEFITVMAAHIM